MNLIPTTATAAEKLRRLAKKHRKTTGSSLAIALDLVAQANGYANWKHVSLCVEQTPSRVANAAPLPQVLVEHLVSEARRLPPLEESERAFRTGLVFAMDVKDAHSMPVVADVTDCDDLWPLAAADIWRVLAHAKDDAAGPSMAESLDADDLAERALEDLANYRFFRFTGAATPSNLNEAFSQVLGKYFFPPVYVWLSGRFIDMASVAEVRVADQVIYASSQGKRGEIVRAYKSPEPISQPADIILDYRSRDGLIFRLDISRLEAGFYESRMSYDGQEIDEGIGFPSIHAALEAAAGVTGDVAGLEVAYRGLIVGTYPLEAIRSQAEQIAKRALATHAAFNEF